MSIKQEISLFDKKILGFKQTTRQFFSSKTNLLVLGAIAAILAVVNAGVAPFFMTLPYLVPLILALFFRDTLAGILNNQAAVTAASTTPEGAAAVQVAEVVEAAQKAEEAK